MDPVIFHTYPWAISLFLPCPVSAFSWKPQQGAFQAILQLSLLAPPCRVNEAVPAQPHLYLDISAAFRSFLHKVELQNRVYGNFPCEPPKRLAPLLLRGLPACLWEWGVPAVMCQVLPCASMAEDDWKCIFNTLQVSQNWLNHRHSPGRYRGKSH